MRTLPSVVVAGVPHPLPDGLHVLDVREDDEWVHGHISGAQHIPLRELPARVHEVPDQQTLVVCRVGARSAQAVGYLLSQQRAAVNLSGGMLSWEAAGRPMVTNTDAAPFVA